MSRVRCLFSHLVERCKERGYDINDAMPCVMRIDGEFVVVDTEHMGYPVAGRTPEEIAEHALRVKEYWASRKPVR